MMNQLVFCFLVVLAMMQVQGRVVGTVGSEAKVENPIPAHESLAIPIEIMPTGNYLPVSPGQQISVESDSTPVEQPSTSDPLMNVQGMDKDGQLTGGDGVLFEEETIEEVYDHHGDDSEVANKLPAYPPVAQPLENGHSSTNDAVVDTSSKGTNVAACKPGSSNEQCTWICITVVTILVIIIACLIAVVVAICGHLWWEKKELHRRLTVSTDKP